MKKLGLNWLNTRRLRGSISKSLLALLLVVGLLGGIWTSPLIAGPTATPAAAPPAPINKTLKVVTRVLPPFVIEENGGLTGFSIDLWREISQEINVLFEFQQASSIKDLLDIVKSGKADIGVGAISVTAQREQEMDFSQPIFDSGLQIMVRNQGSSNSIWRLLSQIFNSDLLNLFGIMLVIILIPGHVIWLVERNHKGGFLENSAYFPGIFKALWWAASTLATQAEEMPKGPVGRIFAVLWMFISVVFIAYFTATVTTSLTVEQLQSSIKGVNDLPGKQIATVKDSSSAKYLQQQRLKTVNFPKIEAAYEALSKAQVDAVVYDGPILLYYAAREGKGHVQIVGGVFRKENYAIAMPDNSPYRKSVNSALLLLQEKGTYQEIYDK